MEENLDIVRRYIEAWHHVDVDEIARLIAPDFVQHGPGSMELVGAQAFLSFVRFFHGVGQVVRLFREVDASVVLHDLFGSGDFVASRVTASGSHVVYRYSASQAFTAASVPGVQWATETPLTTVSVYRLADKKIAEVWQQDSLARFASRMPQFPART